MNEGNEENKNSSEENLSEEEKKERALEEREKGSDLNFDEPAEGKKSPGENVYKESEQTTEQTNEQTNENKDPAQVGEPQDLGKVRDRKQEEREAEKAEVEKKYGWLEIPIDIFPSKGMFYPAGTKVYIRAARGEEIRHFSSIDEQNPYSVNEHLNDIMAACSKIQFPGGGGSYKDFKEEDRIHVILAIHDLTFQEGENKLSFTDECNSCNKPVEFEVKNEFLVFNEPDEKVQDYYSPDERCFVIKTKNYGEIRIEPPSIGIMQKVTEYIKGLQEKGKSISGELEEFTKILPYLVRDWRGFNDDKIQNLFIEYKSWDIKKFSLMDNLVSWVTIGAKNEMKRTCPNPNCGAEITTEVRFPGGIKSLFVISDFTGEFL